MREVMASQMVARCAAAAGLRLRCPRCGEPLDGQISALPDRVVCSGCYFSLRMRGGIWRALPPERVEYYSRFIRDYEKIRSAEGRGSSDREYYLALPYQDLSGANQAQWAIRARTYSYLARHILPSIQSASEAGVRILDAGAGNGWLSYRLAQMGLRPVAVDLLVNDDDGLGAGKHYQEHLKEMFPRFQAESTRLPFASAQFDAVIFNASFHYAESYAATLLEALRCVKTGGSVVIADAPWYARQSSGEQMLTERRAMFLERFGTASNSIASQEFLTDSRLLQLEETLNIRWQRHTPFYGFRWAMRPWIARRRGRREPARFRIYTAKKLV